MLFYDLKVNIDKWPTSLGKLYKKGTTLYPAFNKHAMKIKGKYMKKIIYGSEIKFWDIADDFWMILHLKDKSKKIIVPGNNLYETGDKIIPFYTTAAFFPTISDM